MLFQYCGDFFRLAGSEITVLLLSEEFFLLGKAICGENFVILSNCNKNEDRNVHKYPLLLTTGIC